MAYILVQKGLFQEMETSLLEALESDMALEMFFLDLVGQPLYLEVQVPACVNLNPAQT